MDGLRTVRVLVIDNEVEEAIGFMQALAKERIGAVWYSGKEDELPGTSLQGIRLAALDMDIGEVGTPDIGPTLTALERLVDEHNGPYLAIAWTKHPDLVEEFRDKAATLPCPPIEVIPLVKADVKDSEGSYDFATIATRLRSALEQAYPLGLLAFWEQMVHDSSDSIVEIMSGEQPWGDQSKRTLALLLWESAGEDDPSDVKLRSLLETFSALQFDAIEANAALLDTSQANDLVKPLVPIRKPTEPLPSAPKLNKHLLFGVPLPDVAPGNIYQPEVISAGDKNVFPTIDDLLQDMAQKDKESELKGLGCLAVVMEISPLCDYQQRKIKRARFICGVAVLQENRNLLKQQSDFIRSTPVGREAVIAFDDGPLRGNRVILWDSHYIVSVPPSQVVRESALHRLRQLPLMDIQAWIGSHANRPGYLSIQ